MWGCFFDLGHLGTPIGTPQHPIFSFICLLILQQLTKVSWGGAQPLKLNFNS